MRKIDQSADVTLFIEDRGWLGAGLATLACVGCGVIFYIVWAVDAQMGGALRAAIGLACGIGAFIFIRLVLRTETRRIEIDRARVEWGELSLQVRGDLDVDRRGRPDGELTIRASNWRGMLEVAARSGVLSSDVAQLIERGLDVVADRPPPGPLRELL